MTPHEDVIERLKRIEGKVDIALNGVPGRPDTGLMVRVDRLEQLEKRRGWTLRAILVTVVGFVIDHLFGSKIHF